ncbi:MAG: hypothetical protein KatS3mg087_1011 [Patescibacteria group bacterium]|nr:MAG: hypothetical protein KatS3mg087_1011 [Patescibacteria group bacterium]
MSIIQQRSYKIEIITSIIPELDSFIDKLRESTRNNFLKETNKLLENLDDNLIKRATIILNKQDKLPRYSKIIHEICKIAETLMLEDMINNENLKCNTCNNSGFVEVVNEYYLIRNIIISTTVACNCSIGQKRKFIHNKRFKTQLETYDENKHKLFITFAFLN